MELARGKFPGTSNSLDALCKRFNIDLSKRNKHNALLDCELLREVFINLSDAREPKLVFSKENIPDTASQNKKEDQRHSKKIIQLTEQEIIDHKNFIKKELKKNFY